MAKPTRVLVVDDERDFATPLVFWLRSKGYDTSTVASGQEALGLIRQEPPDIVFLDIRMPGMDGMETLRQIRAFNADLLVIMVTAAYDDQQIFDEATRLGVSGFFPKQRTLPELLTVLETTLRTHVRLKMPPSQSPPPVSS